MRTPQTETIAPLVHMVRGERVLLDSDLAALYGVEPRVLNQAVKRNRNRFPPDFMFRLTPEEAGALRASRSQTVILKRGQNIKHLPYAFTEQGVAMLSSVLRSLRAVEVNIASSPARSSPSKRNTTSSSRSCSMPSSD